MEVNVDDFFQSYGAADHARAKRLLQEQYPDFDISTEEPANSSDK